MRFFLFYIKGFLISIHFHRTNIKNKKSTQLFIFFFYSLKVKMQKLRNRIEYANIYFIWIEFNFRNFKLNKNDKGVKDL